MKMFNCDKCKNKDICKYKDTAPTVEEVDQDSIFSIVLTCKYFSTQESLIRYLPSTYDKSSQPDLSRAIQSDPGHITLYSDVDIETKPEITPDTCLIYQNYIQHIFNGGGSFVGDTPCTYCNKNCIMNCKVTCTNTSSLIK